MLPTGPKSCAVSPFERKSNLRPPCGGHPQRLYASGHSQCGDARTRRANVRGRSRERAAQGSISGHWRMEDEGISIFQSQGQCGDQQRRPTSIIAAPVISLRNPATAARILDRINLAVSRGLQRDHRDDTISDMTCVWLEGRLREDDIEKRASNFARARFKSGHIKYGDLSLDVPIHVDGSATLLDRLSTETESGYWDPNVMASTGGRK
jgi:hypothetical protein